MDKNTLALMNVVEQWEKLQPLNESKLAKLRRRFTIDFNYNSNHIEGNTLTYGQTEILLMFGRVVQCAEMKDLEDMKASNVGLLMMQEEASISDMPLTETFIRQLHHTLLREDYTVYRQLPGGVQTSYVVHAGTYKTRPNSVIIRYGDRFNYASPEETPALMNDLVSWYNEEEQKGILSPFELAILFHYRYIRIHPFEDGNGRISRLMVNFILARHGYPMIVVRSRKKQEYLEALHKADLNVGLAPYDGAHASLEQIAPFHQYFIKLLEEEIKADILFVTVSDENVWWFDGESITFKTPTAPKILRMLWADPQISESEIISMLGINRSAVQKQLNNLQKKGYILKADGKWYVSITPSM